MSSAQSSKSETGHIFAARLRAVRQLRNLSQRELARRCGLSINQINRYEQELFEPSVSALRAIARELNVSVDYLVGFTPETYRPPLPGEINSSEQELLDMLHREGWPGVIRLGVEKISK